MISLTSDPASEKNRSFAKGELSNWANIWEPLKTRILIEIQDLEKKYLRFKGFCFFHNTVVHSKGSYYIFP